MITLQVTPITEAGELPQAVTLELLKELTNKSDRTLTQYRRLAYSLVDDYKQSCTIRYPSYFAALSEQWRRQSRGERVRVVFPDPYPLTQTEARIILGISRLFDQHKLESAVIAEIEQNPYFWGLTLD